MQNNNNETGYREHLLSPAPPNNQSTTTSTTTTSETSLIPNQQETTTTTSTTNNKNDITHDDIKDNDDEFTDNVDTTITSSFELPITTTTYIITACAALNSANLGYDVGVNTGVAKLLQDDLNLSDVQLEIFMGSLNFYAMIGALGAQYVTDRFGRRKSFIVAALGFIVGIVVMTLSYGYIQLMLGRVFVGLGVGFGLACILRTTIIDPLYISEISPAPHRGRLVTWSEIALNVGIVLGFSSGLFFYTLPDNIAWRYMFGLGMVLPTILIILALFVMPESPRWLVQKGHVAKATDVLIQLYPPGYDVDAVVREINESIAMEIETRQAVGWKTIFQPTPAVRRMLLVGVGMAVAQQAVGIDAVQYFLVYILDEAGIDDRMTQGVVLVGLGLLKLALIVVAGPLFDVHGRRIMFFVSLGGMTMALLLLALTFLSSELNAPLTVIALALYLAFFSFGMGPGAWLIPSEVFSTTIRAKAMSLATFSNRVTATLMASTFLTMANVMTWPGYFCLLAGVCVAVGVFVFLCLPETKGKSLEEMGVYFAEVTGDATLLELERVVTENSSTSAVS